MTMKEGLYTRGSALQYHQVAANSSKSYIRHVEFEFEFATVSGLADHDIGHCAANTDNPEG